jgi:hypothetical protein
MQPIMRKSSPQLILSAAACVLAMAALTLSAPSITEYPASLTAPVPAVAGIETPALPDLPFLIP